MNPYLPNFLRGAVSSAGNVLLMTTLLQPKYSHKVTILTMSGICAAIFSSSVHFYLHGDLTMLAKMDILLFAVLCFAVRPLFKDTFMQWLFSFITVQNIACTVIILSFLASRGMPYPAFANTLLRILLYTAFYLLFSRRIHPLYHQAVKYWASFFAVAAGIIIAFIYYIITAEDIAVMITKQAVPLLLIILIEFASYASIFVFLQNLQHEYAAKEENLRIKTDSELLQISVKSMAERIRIMDETAQRNNLAAHDRRHFYRMTLELLEHGQTEKAIDLLRSQVSTSQKGDINFCENVFVNAAVCYYAGKAKDSGISFISKLDIPNELTIDSLELSMVVSNLLENALQACNELPLKNSEKMIHFNCCRAGRLILEMENSCLNTVLLDENGYPQSLQQNHGLGTKSILAFVNKYDGELFYRIQNGRFRVRMLV